MIIVESKRRKNSTILKKYPDAILADVTSGAKADSEYDKFKERTKNELTAVEIHFIEQFEREQKKLSDKRNQCQNKSPK